MVYEGVAVHQDEERRKLQHFLDEVWGASLRDVLDVGCGTSLPVALPPSVHLVGLDVSSEALAANENINEAIVANIETDPLREEAYDAVICWNVLEHLASPRRAVANMATALRPRGLLIVGVPNLWSLKGLVTKLTPHRFHRWAYSHVLGWPEIEPFKTHLHSDVVPKRLARRAMEEGLEQIYASTYTPALRLPRPVGVVWSGVAGLGRIASLGAWDPEASEHIAVFRKAH
jgi:SAM-dependent methyltransferase